MTTPAMRRGPTRYLNGLVESVTSASICSVTRMVPSSAAIEAPTRPATMRPASTGPKFARDAERHDRGDQAFGIEARRAEIDLQRQRAAGEEGGEADDGQRVVADPHHLIEDLADIDGRRQPLRAARP